MSARSQQIQALLVQVDEALHQLSPPIPWLVWGDGIRQSCQVLQQVRDYLVTLSQSVDLDPLQSSPAESAQQQSQLHHHLQAEIQALVLERHRLLTEINQLQVQIQQQSAQAPVSDPAAQDFREPVSASTDSTPSPPPSSSTEYLPFAGSEIPHPAEHHFISGSVEPTAQDQNLTEFSQRSIDAQPRDHSEDQWDNIFEAPLLASIPPCDHSIHLDSSEPSMDGEDYILALPHESLLPTEEEADQVDSLLLVNRGTVQRLESELMGLEQSLDFQGDEIESELNQWLEPDSTEHLTLNQLREQMGLNLAQSDSDATQPKLTDLLNPFHPNHIPFNLDPASSPVSLEALSQDFPPPQTQKNPGKSREHG